MDVLMDNSLALMLIGIFAIASLFHGVTGIGVTLIASTALASVYPMPTVLVLTVFPCLIINWFVFVSGGNAFDYVRRYWLLVLTSFVGSLIGTKLVFVIAQSYLLIALGLLIVAYVVMQIISWQIPQKHSSAKHNRQFNRQRNAGRGAWRRYQCHVTAACDVFVVGNRTFTQWQNRADSRKQSVLCGGQSGAIDCAVATDISTAAIGYGRHRHCRYGGGDLFVCWFLFSKQIAPSAL